MGDYAIAICLYNTITHDFRFANSSGEETILPIVFREDGYISVTKVAQHFPGKRLPNFMRLDSTAEYMEALKQYLGSESLVITKRGGRKGEAGTWYHPKLAVFFARWLDVRFAVWCDLMIDASLEATA
ncbi:MAG: KilA-N domain-containing protein [Zoogloeaceae bacterium]|nr:KilA-N domain-containing protein [Zoogloeaceae bacterium]